MSPAHTGEGALSVCPPFRCSVCPACHGESAESDISAPSGQAATASEGLFPKSCNLPQRAAQGACSSGKPVGEQASGPSFQVLCFLMSNLPFVISGCLMIGASWGHEKVPVSSMPTGPQVSPSQRPCTPSVWLEDGVPGFCRMRPAPGCPLLAPCAAPEESVCKGSTHTSQLTGHICDYREASSSSRHER